MDVPVNRANGPFCCFPDLLALLGAAGGRNGTLGRIERTVSKKAIVLGEFRGYSMSITLTLLFVPFVEGDVCASSGSILGSNDIVMHVYRSFRTPPKSWQKALFRLNG